MKYLNKIILSLIAVLLVLTLAACGNNSGDLDGSSEAPHTSDTASPNTDASGGETEQEEPAPVIPIETIEPVKFIIGGVGIERFGIYSEFSDKNVIKEASSVLLRCTGIGSDEKKIDDAGVLFLAGAKDIAGGNEWSITAEKGRLLIKAATEKGQIAAFDAFTQYFRENKGKEFSIAAGTVREGGIPSKEEYLNQDRLVIYPDFHKDINRNYDYRVTVTMDGETYPLTVYNHTMEYSILGRSIGSDNYRRFTRFAFSGDERVRVDIKVSRDFDAYSVIPSAKKFDSTFEDGVISVYLDEPDYFLIRLDNDDNSLISVVADYPEYVYERPSKTDPNVIYIDDWYETESGLLRVEEPNSVIYVEPQAVLNCRVYIDKKATGTKMYGRGAVADPFSDIYNYKIRDGGTEGNSYKLTSINCANGTLDGLFYLDTRAYNIAVNNSDVKITNIKCFSTLMTTDGISVYGGKDTVADHCLLYVGDNAIVYSATNTVFTDITIGTTCAALFPQGNTKNTLFDGIYIFRTNDGVINNQYNGNQIYERTHENIIKNLDCMDCINIPHFFRGRKMGQLAKTFIFENVSIPSPTGTSDPRDGMLGGGAKRIYILDNLEGSMYTDNYTLTFKNFYMGGVLLEGMNQIRGTNDGKNNRFIFEKENNGYRKILRNWNETYYKSKDKVMIGNYLFSPAYELVTRDGVVYFPTNSILKGLRRTGITPEAVEIGGIKYSTAEALIRAGAAEDYSYSEKGHQFIPCYDGEELFLADSGEISRFSETGSYMVDMEVEDWSGETVYVMYDHENYYTGGVSRMITEEIKMYGKGRYILSFDICGPSSGGAKTAVTYDDYRDTYKLLDKQISFGNAWSNVSVEIEVTDSVVGCEACIFSVVGVESSKIDYFALKNFSFKKVK